MVAVSKLPPAAKAERKKDWSQPLPADPGLEATMSASVDWLCRAQDCSTTKDGGVSHDFHLIHGWGSSYPETTGYIIPTLLTESKIRNDAALRARVVRMLDWLISIQLSDGGYQGGRMGRTLVVPVTFVTGQILIGLAAGVAEFGDKYRSAMVRAADWLVEVQDPDGAWRKGRSPFAKAGEVAYETHAAWGLVEAARLQPNAPYGEAALRNVRWAMKLQQENGWFDKCCLADFSQPSTHTLAYTLRGIIEAYRYRNDADLLDSAKRLADGLMSSVRKDGWLSGCLRSDWTPSVKWTCPTGSVQTSACWLILYEITKDARYRDAAFKVNEYTRRTVKIDGDPDIRGAVKGAYPVDGEFQPYEYPNWAAKFFIDAQRMEKTIRDRER